MFSSFGVRVGFVVLSGVFAVACAGAEGASGAKGESARMSVAPEPAGVNCANGGQAMTYGVDEDGDGKLEESEVDGTSYVCNGTAGAPGVTGIQGPTGVAGANGLDGKDGVDGKDGADGKDGVNGVDGTNGVDGKNGKDAPVVVLGQFLASQVVAGMVVTCASTNLGATTAECRGLKIDGLDVYLGPSEASAICAGITGKGYNSANGMGVVPAPWMSLSAGKWTIASSGNASPMQNLTCNR